MTQALATRCCIVGAGPAGMVLGLLLARAGVPVVVLEKHADFLRDFRGDTVHPSTLQVLHELGLLDAFLQRPHQKVRVLGVSLVGDFPGEEVRATVADFSRLRTRCNFIALMPQWDFLDFLYGEAARYPHFRLLRQTEATGVLEHGGRIAGVQARSGEGPLEVAADLVVACDGRHSVLRAAAGLAVRELGAPIDVLWLRLPRDAGDPASTGGRLGRGRFLVMIDRGDYWQCAFVIPKGGIGALQQRGFAAFQQDVAAVAPFLEARLRQLAGWDDVKLLSVAVDRLERWWRPGLLCIGDAAHAMSPIGGVGINLAVQDAVATANRLAPALADAQGWPAARLDPLLAAVQRRRAWPARVTQAVQVLVQNRVLAPALADRGPAHIHVPLLLRLLDHWPWLQGLPARAVGIGVRPEHLAE